MNHATVKSEQGSSPSFHMEMDESSNSSKKLILKVIVQKSTNELLYARAGEDFVDFLFSFVGIPLGRIGSLLGSNNSPKSINNLYRSIADLIDSKFLVSPDTKNKLIELKLPLGSISPYQILPLTAPHGFYLFPFAFSSPDNFPNGQGKYVKGLKKYIVADDLTVTPFCISSTISILNGLKIPIFDIKEVELQIGLQEALRMLKASLTSTRVLTDALTINLKQPKQDEH